MIIFMGTPEFAVPILQMLIDKKYPISLVVTQPDKKVGRKQNLTPSPVKQLALANGIEVFQPLKVRDEFQYILDKQPKVLITAAYGQILPKALLNGVRSYNLHGSLLPNYRGGAPIQYALFNNDQITGVTLMEMVYKMDAGDMIDKAVVEIDESDDYESLSIKLSNCATKLLEEWIQPLLDNNYLKEPQDPQKITFAYTLKYEDELIDWNQPLDLVLGKIRGLSPNIGATAFINGETIKIFNAQKSDIIEIGRPGLIKLEKKELLVKTLDGWISIKKIQQQGKKQMEINAYLNGQTLIKDGHYFTLKETEECQND